MRKFCYKSLAILLMITMLMTYLPLQVFATQQSFEDRFKLYDEETETFVFVDTGFPEVEIVFRDEEENVIGTATTQPDGTIVFPHTGDYAYTLCSYGIADDQPYKIVFKNAADALEGNHNDYLFVVDYIDGSSLMDIQKQNVYIRAEYGSVSIHKSQSGNDTINVPNATYQIAYIGTDGHPLPATVIHTGKTDANGNIQIDGLLCGNYTIKEIEAPNGYFIDTNTYTFKVDKNKTTSVKVSNEAKCQVVLEKRDKNTNESLSNVTFALYNDNTGSAIGTYKTDNDGQIKVENLHYGKYYFIETQPKENYEANNTKYHFELNGNTTKQQIVVENTPYPNITFEKYDKDTNQPLENAIFEIYEKSNLSTPIFRSIGSWSFALQLKPGDYILKEVVKPSNDYLQMDDYTFTVKSGTSATHKLYNEKYKVDVIIHKTDSETNEYLNGVTFQLSGPQNYSWTTDNKPFELKGLTPGTYIIKETNCPAGYIKGGDITFTIDANKPTIDILQNGATRNLEQENGAYNIEIQNTPIHLVINKKDNISNDHIAGAEFTLYALNELYQKVEYKHFTTNGEPIKIEYIPAGEYLLIETKIPVGYAKGAIEDNSNTTGAQWTTAGIHFTIEDNPYNEVTVFNNRVYGKITINKVAKQYDKTNTRVGLAGLLETWFSFTMDAPLKGAKFVLKAAENIYDPSGNGNIIYAKDAIVQPEVETKENGQIIFEQLLFGKYIIEETYAPVGFLKADPITIVIDENNKDVKRTITDENEEIAITVTKTDSKTNKGVADAIYGLYTKEINAYAPADTLIASAKTDVNGIAQFNEYLPKGKYYVKEISAPNGYILSEEIRDIDFSNRTDKKENVFNVAFQNTPVKLTISKKDAVDDSFVVGATMQLLTEDGTVVKEWVTTNSNQEIEYLIPNTYILHEKEAPAGYKNAPDQTIVVKTTTDNVATVIDERIQGSIHIKKTDTDGEALGGVHFLLKDGNTIIDEGYTNSNGDITFTGLAVGLYKDGVMFDKKTYEIEEVAVPEGYIILTQTIEATFDLTEASNNKTTELSVSVKNDYTKLSFAKLDAETNEMIANAKLAIYRIEDMDGNAPRANAIAVREWVSKKNEVYTTTKLPLGSYAIVEVEAPDGYLVSEPVFFTITDEKVVITSMKDDFTKISIDKIDVDGNKVIGAKLGLFSANANNKSEENALEVWTTDGTSHRIDRLPIGVYTIVELDVPNGYVKAEDMSINIEAVNHIQEFVMVDEYTQVEFHKLEINTENVYVENSHLQLYRIENGNTTIRILVDEWDTTSAPHLIKKLPAGKYELVETVAGEGYTYAEPLKFDVLAIAGVQTVKMFDDFTKVSFSKLEEAVKPEDRHLLSNAHLAIYKEADIDENGDVIDGAQPVKEWISEEAPTTFTKLPVGNYVLKEIKAPNGYVLAKNINFTVRAVNEVQYVEMINDFTKLEISKTDSETGEFVVGALLGLYKAEDINADGSIKDNAQHYEKWTTTNEPHYIYRIPAGEYVLVELIAPTENGYIKAENVNVNVESIVEVQKVNMKDNFTTVSFNKLEKGTENVFVNGAGLAVYRAEDINADGTIKEGALPAYEWTTNGTHTIKRMPVGNYVLVETKTPFEQGYITARNIEFTVTETSDEQTITMFDDYTKIYISKVDAETKEQVYGAKLELYDVEDVDANGNPKQGTSPIIEWYSDEDLDTVKIPVGNYVIIETETPAGYVKGDNFPIEIIEMSKIQFFQIENDFTKIEIEKVSKDTQTKLDGAHLEIYNINDYVDGALLDNAQPVYEWVSSQSAHTITRIPVGQYVIIETEAPDGYVRMQPYIFTVEATTELQKFVVENDFTKIEISKTDAQTGETIGGAKLELYFAKDVVDGNVAENAEPICSWVSDKLNTFSKNKLPVGDYVIVETQAPAGYVKAEPQFIRVEEAGNVQSFVVANDIITIAIHKVDIATKEHLSGALLQLVDTEGNIVHEWISGDAAYIAERVPYGTYYIVEKSSPDGYVIAEQVEIEVIETSKLQEYTIENDFTKVEIVKKDEITGETLEGAKFELLNEYGEKVAEWVTTKETMLVERLPAGKYKLIEVAAPNGYLNDNIETEIIVENIVDVQQFVVTNNYTKIEISKIDKTSQQLLQGAKLELYDAEGNLVCSWTSPEGAYYIEKLQPGKYTIVETEAPAGYILQKEPVEIIVEPITDVQKFVITNDYTKLGITKIDKETGEALSGAKLHIEDENGNIVFKWTSSLGEHVLYSLPSGTYKLVEDEAPTGYALAEAVTFEITDSGEWVRIIFENQEEIFPEKPQTGDTSPNTGYPINTTPIIVLISSLMMLLAFGLKVKVK